MNAWTWRALGLGAVAAAAVAAWLFLGQEQSGDKISAEAPQPGTSGDIALQGTATNTTMATVPAEAAPPPPTFDIVRVEKDGSLVAAGRAEPGAEVTLLDGTNVVESTKAGLDGSWALVTTQPLPPGDRELSIAAILPDGTVVPSEQVVVVHVPEPAVAAAEPSPSPAPAPAEVAAAVEGTAQEVVTAVVPEASESATAATTSSDEVMVVLTDKTGEGGTEVLQGGAEEEIPATAVIISAVDYDVDGKLIVSGQAAAGANLIIYLDDQPVGQGKADGEGRFILLPDRTADAGDHRIRVDQVGGDGKVLARAETPFTRTEVIARAAEGRFVVVERGNSLWRIARGEYGEGLRYSVIYEANKTQIKNPDLIYPGQIFLIPASD